MVHHKNSVLTACIKDHRGNRVDTAKTEEQFDQDLHTHFARVCLPEDLG